MSARKVRPALGTPVTDSMSERDIISALGVSAAELHRWKALARIPEAEFERRIAWHREQGAALTATSMIGPAPARGRVQRAVAIINAMTDPEQRKLHVLIGGAA